MEPWSKNWAKQSAALLCLPLFFCMPAALAATDLRQYFRDKEQCKKQTEEMSKKHFESILKSDEKKICASSLKSRVNFLNGDMNKSVPLIITGKDNEGACEGNLTKIKDILGDFKSYSLEICENAAKQIQELGCGSNTGPCAAKVYQIIQKSAYDRTARLSEAQEKIKKLPAVNNKVIGVYNEHLTCLSTLPPQALTATSSEKCKISDDTLSPPLPGTVTLNPPTMQTYLNNLKSMNENNPIKEQKKVLEISQAASRELSSISGETSSQAVEANGLIKQIEANNDKAGGIDSKIGTANSAVSAAQGFMGGKTTAASAVSTLAAGLAAASSLATNHSPSSVNNTSGGSVESPHNSNYTKNKDTEKNLDAHNSKNAAIDDSLLPAQSFAEKTFKGVESGDISATVKANLASAGNSNGSLTTIGEKSAAHNSITTEGSGTKIANLGGGTNNEFTSGNAGTRRDKEEKALDTSGDIAAVLSKMKSMFDMDTPPVASMNGGGHMVLAESHEALENFENEEGLSTEHTHRSPMTANQGSRGIASNADLENISLFSRVRQVHKKCLQKGLIRFDARIRI